MCIFVYREAEIDLPPPLEMEPTVIVEEKTSLAIEETIQEQKDDSPESKAQVRKILITTIINLFVQ